MMPGSPTRTTAAGTADARGRGRVTTGAAAQTRGGADTRRRRHAAAQTRGGAGTRRAARRRVACAASADAASPPTEAPSGASKSATSDSLVVYIHSSTLSGRLRPAPAGPRR
jgi:hypothetical protein